MHKAHQAATAPAPSRSPLLVTTKVAAAEIGIGEGTLKALARTVPGFPQPISLLSDHPTRRQFRWRMAALREFFERDNPLTVQNRAALQK